MTEKRDTGHEYLQSRHEFGLSLFRLAAAFHCLGIYLNSWFGHSSTHHHHPPPNTHFRVLQASHKLLFSLMDTDNSCGNIDNGSDLLHLRIASLFIILITSTFAALFPVLAKRSKFVQIPDLAYEYVYLFYVSSSAYRLSFSAAKYFGSGVIVSIFLSHTFRFTNTLLSLDSHSFYSSALSSHRRIRFSLSFRSMARICRSSHLLILYRNQFTSNASLGLLQYPCLVSLEFFSWN